MKQGIEPPAIAGTGEGWWEFVGLMRRLASRSCGWRAEIEALQAMV